MPNETKLTFAFERETKNAVRFMEKGDEAGHKVGTLYVKKAAFGGTIPQEITVTISSK